MSDEITAYGGFDRMKFSVIVPVYNVEKYVRKCLLSILNQTCQDFEIIVVNDGATDRSMFVVNEIMEQYTDKIKVINQENKGLGGARNTGVRLAAGQYLVFIDSDDYIKDTMLEILSKCINKKNYDMIVFNAYEDYDEGSWIKDYDMCEGFSGEMTVEQEHKILLIPPAAWNKVYRREFFLKTGLCYPEKTLYEDAAITKNLLERAESILFCNENLYYYVQRSGSIMHSKISEKMKDIMKVNTLMMTEFKSEDVFEKYYKEIEYIAARPVLLIILKNILTLDYKNEIGRELVDYVKKNFPGYLENQYLNEQDRMQCTLLWNYEFKQYYKRYCRKSKIVQSVKVLIPRKIQTIYRKVRHSLT
ncbi:MAG: glycosyltransferase family 2 protein [Lachnospiraceae bacterium]|nr:glycosyltransferase family 2 protein [Lachnospiraceae bacterium]